MDIVASSVIETTKGIYKSTVTKHSGNWEIWCTFLTHTGVKEKLLGGTKHRAKTTLVPQLTASVRRNQFGTTMKYKLLHGTSKDVILDVSASY